MSAETTRRRVSTLRLIATSCLIGLLTLGASSANAYTEEPPENPKAYLGPTPDNLSKSWIKRFDKIQAKLIKFRVTVNGKPSVPPVYRVKGCYATAYQQMMRMRKPALKGPNYGYWGDLGGVNGGYRGWRFMSELAQAATGAYYYGFIKVKPKAKRKRLKRKMRKQALYWANRGLTIWKEGKRTDFAYIPDGAYSDTLVNIPGVIRRPNLVQPSIVGVYPQPKRCKR